MLNMDFGQRVVIDTNRQDWVASPRPGVWRRPLAREEAERGHATSIVRYQAGASFPEHDHPLGEEILVLEGTFSDASGDFGAGTYFRNPPGFRHAPFSRDGCVILVKLHQFQPGDTSHVCIDTGTARWLAGPAGLSSLPLHEFAGEKVSLLRWPAGECYPHHVHSGGEETFVMAGQLRDEHGSYPAGTWVRSPAGSAHGPCADVDTLIWLKTGHLPAT